MAEQEPWYGGVVKSVVLPFVLVGGALVGLWFLLKSFILNPFEQAGQALGKLIDQYDREYEGFMENDGTIDSNEKAILEAKMELMRPLTEGLANAIPSVERIILELVIVVGAIYVTVRALKGDFKILKRVGGLWDVWYGKAGKPDPGAGNQVASFITAEELALMGRLSGIMTLADLGFTGLASTALTAEQSGYFANVLPQMQASYNLLSLQLPYLTGMQLAFAQYMMAQYNMYITYYATTLPPLFMMLPPI